MSVIRLKKFLRFGHARALTRRALTTFEFMGPTSFEPISAVPMLPPAQQPAAESSEVAPTYLLLRPGSSRMPNARSNGMCDDSRRIERRSVLKGITTAAAAASALASSRTAEAAPASYTDPPNPVLPNPGMRLDIGQTALVVIDPQIDFLSPKGAAWPVLGESVTEHGTVANLARLFEASKNAGI